MEAPPRQEIIDLTAALSDKAAWDDTALIRAYERAIKSYKVSQGVETRPNSGKHASRLESFEDANGSSDSEEEDDEEEESDEGEEGEVASREIRLAEASAAAQAEADEEERLAAWAQYYQYWQEQPAAGGAPGGAPGGGSAGAAPRPQTGSHAAAASCGQAAGSWPAPHMQMPQPPSAHATAPPALAAAGSPEYETDLSNLMMAWYHCGYFTAKFQDRWRTPS